ncbi:hypothetical protein EYF80_031663 [Liparis tanakae]|uniref:Uncharacterized protein n=1 Tax=Liparis tanakae TaxID=230148 RepID=A0A4Z2GXZ5_9TELE|nr:hypothetical protein EYF80_031663 [Liparis tanakae]
MRPTHQKCSRYLVDVKEEYGEVDEDDDEEGQDEDDGQRGENPHQVLQNTQVVLQLAQAGPLLTRMEHTHLWTDADGSAHVGPEHPGSRGHGVNTERHRKETVSSAPARQDWFPGSGILLRWRPQGEGTRCMENICWRGEVVNTEAALHTGGGQPSV